MSNENTYAIQDADPSIPQLVLTGEEGEAIHYALHAAQGTAQRAITENAGDANVVAQALQNYTAVGKLLDQIHDALGAGTAEDVDGEPAFVAQLSHNAADLLTELTALVAFGAAADDFVQNADPNAEDDSEALANAITFGRLADSAAYKIGQYLQAVDPQNTAKYVAVASDFVAPMGGQYGGFARPEEKAAYDKHVRLLTPAHAQTGVYAPTRLQ